jgi:hypothetical protein
MGKDIRMTTHDGTELLADEGNLDAEIDALADKPAALRKLLRGKGAKEAVKALLGVCRDPRAPAPAKATAGAAVLRAAGLFERVDVPDEDAEPVTIESCERTIATLEALIAKADKKLPPVATSVRRTTAPEPTRPNKPGNGLFD